METKSSNKSVKSWAEIKDRVYGDKGTERRDNLEIVTESFKGLVGFMKGLRAYFIKNYPVDYVVGGIYYGDMTITYFPFTPKALKEQKLKIAVVFNHRDMRFEVWLAGQNKQIQRKYWEFLKGSDLNKYHIPSSVENGFSIVDSILVENPDFDNPEILQDHIETRTMEFIKDILKVIE